MGVDDLDEKDNKDEDNSNNGTKILIARSLTVIILATRLF
jgi:hypothetical protein